MPRSPVIGMLAALTLALFAMSASAATTGRATISSHRGPLGTMLVDAKGRTLYAFTKDRHNRSTCTGACAREWPPVVGKRGPVAAGRVRTSLLGVVRRPNGEFQAAYGGRPLYRFTGDNAPGMMSGEGVHDFGGTWQVLGVDSKPLAAHHAGGY